MAYQNFIPTIWAEAINRELERVCVFAEDCNRRYEGTISKKGDSVRILGVGKPTITETTDKEITLGTAETVEDTSVILPVNHIAYFNYKVDDIDKRQAVGGLMDALSTETSEGLANVMDGFIAKLAADKLARRMEAAPYVVNEENILKKIDDAIERLFSNDVKAGTEIVLTVPPRFYFMLKRAYVHLDTDNSAMIKNGRVGRYGAVTVKMSNNVATENSGATDLIMLRTKRAIAFVNPMTHTEPYRPEKSFSDAVKGFTLYDGKIVRPKELVVMNVKYA